MSKIKEKESENAIGETHRLGRLCGAHAHGATGIASCVEAGMDTTEHGTFLDEASAEKKAARGIYLVPTLLVSHSRRQGGGDKSLQKREEDLMEDISVLTLTNSGIETVIKEGKIVYRDLLKEFS